MLSGSMDTTYRLTRQKSGSAATQEFAQTNTYSNILSGFLVDRRFLTFTLNGDYSRDSSNHDSPGQKNEDSSQDFNVGSTLTFFPTSQFPLLLYFQRNQGNTDKEISGRHFLSGGPGLLAAQDSHFRSQNYGFNLGMKEKGWLPHGSLSFNRDAQWEGGLEGKEERVDYLRLMLLKRKEWKKNDLQMDYNFYRTDNKTSDHLFQAQTLGLRNFIRLSDTSSLSLGSAISHMAGRNDHENSYTGDLGYSQSFDPTFSIGLGTNYQYRRGVHEETSNLSAYAFANKRKEFSSKLWLTATLNGYLADSEEIQTSRETLRLNLSSRNIPYVVTSLMGEVAMGQSGGGRSSLQNSLSLNLSTYAWRWLRLNGGFGLSHSSGGGDSTSWSYQLGMELRPWRNLTWTSQISLNSYEATRSLQEERKQELEERKGELGSLVDRLLSPVELTLPSEVSRPLQTKSENFTWTNQWSFQPLYWINTTFSYNLFRSEDNQKDSMDSNSSHFTGRVRLLPPFLPRLSFVLSYYQDESQENGQNQSGWQGSAEFYRGKTTFTLDFDFDKVETSNHSNTNNSIFLRIHRNVGKRLW